MTSPFAFLHNTSLLKRVYTKRKGHTLKGSKFIPFRIDPSTELGWQIILIELPPQFKGIGYTFRGSNSGRNVCLPCEKGSTIKGKNLLPLGSNSFLLK